MVKNIVIVDPYSSGSLLAARFRAAGFEPIALHMRPLQGKLAKSFIKDDFEHSYVFDGNIENILTALTKHDIAMIVPGQEAGVELADQLNHRLGIKCNSMQYSHARRDKFEMHKRIAAAGLREISQICTGNFDEIAEWANQRNKWPIVVKPVNSGGTDGVKICQSLEDIRVAFDNNISKVNLLGFKNTQVLAQEFIAGVEYVVDTVSCDGKHYVSSMTRYRKEILDDGSPIYKAMEFFAPNDPLHAGIVSYAKNVLNALGIECGPAHTEIFVDENGPVLVECGARLFGGLIPRYQERATRVSPLDLTIDSYVNPEKFHERTREPQQYDKNLTVLMMSTPKGGQIVEQPGKKLVSGLRSYHDAIWFSGIGDNITSTKDIVSGVGLLVLLHSDQSQIEEDIDTFNSWEAEGKLVTLV